MWSFLRRQNELPPTPWYPLIKLYNFYMSICPYLQKHGKPYTVQVSEEDHFYTQKPDAITRPVFSFASWQTVNDSELFYA